MRALQWPSFTSGNIILTPSIYSVLTTVFYSAMTRENNSAKHFRLFHFSFLDSLEGVVICDGKMEDGTHRVTYGMYSQLGVQWDYVGNMKVNVKGKVKSSFLHEIPTKIWIYLTLEFIESLPITMKSYNMCVVLMK